MNIAIIGTRGIPNRYGGFEQLAEKLSVGLVQKGHSITVYNSHKHPYKKKEFDGVQVIHCYDAEHLLGTAGQFIYDLNCIRDARKRNFDAWLFLGYTSSSVWRRFFPKHTFIISNMDGLEWKRSKYNPVVRRFLQYAEKLAVKYSDQLIADSPAIEDYLKTMYGSKSHYIPYGAEVTTTIHETALARFNVKPGDYFMLMARMEKENNIDMILEGFRQTNSTKKFVVVGNTGNSFGRLMVKKFSTDKRILFVGAVYDNEINHTMRNCCSLYFHGHSVGGTNPSLLEAMASGAMIAAHKNEFNRAVLSEDGYYFSSADDVKQLVVSCNAVEQKQQMTENNLNKIRNIYNWPLVIGQYDKLISKR